MRSTTMWLVITLTILVAVLSPALAQAHFIWIETEPRWEPGKSQEIRVYFGEPHESLREEAGGRLDQHHGLHAWVVDPKGEKFELALRQAVNRFVGTFVPRLVGRHNIVVASGEHAVMDLRPYDRGVVKPLFYARSQALAFEPGRVSEREEEIKEPAMLDIVPVTRALEPVKGSIVPKAGSEVVVRVVFKGQPLAGRRVNAFGPNGWIKELQSTDSWGVTSFVPLWPGRYVLAVLQDDKAPGQFKGKTYEALDNRATFSVLVDKID